MKQMAHRNIAWDMDESRLLNEDPEPEQLAEVEEIVAEATEDAPIIGEPTIDAVQHYLQEIGRVALLTANEEIELAERMERGDAARWRLESPDELSPQLHVALNADVVSGKEARRHLIQANLRLVVS